MAGPTRLPRPHLLSLFTRTPWQASGGATAAPGYCAPAAVIAPGSLPRAPRPPYALGPCSFAPTYSADSPRTRNWSRSPLPRRIRVILDLAPAEDLRRIRRHRASPELAMHLYRAPVSCRLPPLSFS
ncbi:hypothetical protein TRIUR3_32368 [Triticum urartu]|uniref:Uncharacterized protein n=1 Tax=Triticum urartu TaxID=4572 RepID=M7YDA1_TRIUA|nr:hypothetical protein TRIUR3_32368 [Triticum urartu]